MIRNIGDIDLSNVNNEEIIQFIVFWQKKCEEFKLMNLSNNEYKKQFGEFRLKKEVILAQNSPTHFHREQIEPPLDMLQTNVELALLVAFDNYRREERVRLKESYGFLSELIFLLGKMLGKY